MTFREWAGFLGSALIVAWLALPWITPTGEPAGTGITFGLLALALGLLGMSIASLARRS
ncbi:hypothetical protein [Actinocorallia sp. A-T 12471]|uniref:hypothetical protein n=1 Tax=Actinocorallia sp. A-T 12471 TaxID=3089813 RepID=UPI0029CF8353|nr:hypothetical protein [Actinocorallia sp. A-T 12471]MDX6741035.1 hypothetical protein [Actinocorallia sp. A-T 12471]